MKGKKRIALLTVFILIINLFAPYSILFKNTVEAATGTIEENPFILSNLGITQKGANRMLTVQLGIGTEEVINGLDLMIKVDTNKLKPCNKNTGAPMNSINLITAQSDYCTGNFYIKKYDATTGVYTFQVVFAGGFDVMENGYIPGGMGDPDFDDAGEGENRIFTNN
ncbi:MAG: hypothetical protein HFJ50_01670 [Clostridia bacterium]|nr:hypothetical protein [Clostridia bacterium]